MFPISRRGQNNTYCRPLSKSIIEKIRNAQSLSCLIEEIDTRYHKLNIKAYYRHSTIEFRQHAGSTDFEKISNWIILSQALVERATLETIKLTHDRDKEDVYTQERRLRYTLFGKAVGRTVKNSDYGLAFKYMSKRRREFAKKEKKRVA